MKTNVKALELIEKGLTSQTVSKLSESQINILHKKLFVEQTQTGITMVPAADTAKQNQLKQQKKTFQVYEKEMDEDVEVDKDDASAGEYTQDMPQKSAPDGMDDDLDDPNEKNVRGAVESVEESKKYGKKNPWAICHAQVGPKKTRKFERCVMSVKKQLEEGKNPVSLFLENEITKIVEKHIPPRITKGDLMKYILESSPKTKPAPAKPDVKPTTKPRPSHPGKNPNPGENPAPKAKKGETKEASPEPKTKPAPTKPDVKPTTKPRPSHPGKNPNPGENPAPKAGKISAEDAKEIVIDTIMNLLQK